MSPIQHVSDMDTVNGMSPALDQYNRVNQIAFTESILAKAAAYTIQPEDSGKLIHATAAGPTTFTLPAVADSTGMVVDFFCTGAGGMVISAPAGKLKAKDNAAATTATYTTAANMIGAGCRVVCDGAFWLFQNTSALTVVIA